MDVPRYADHSRYAGIFKSINHRDPQGLKGTEEHRGKPIAGFSDNIRSLFTAWISTFCFSSAIPCVFCGRKALSDLPAAGNVNEADTRI
jgi:hypothetical protein